jgi:hypothetical protein
MTGAPMAAHVTAVVFRKPLRVMGWSIWFSINFSLMILFRFND